MRIHLQKIGARSGSVLTMTLVLAMILGITLGGYLYWVRTQNLLVAQSQAWNLALAMAEAGVEEGLAQINNQFGTNYISGAQANWGGSGGIFGPRANTLTNGSYSAIIVRTNPGPTIISTGYARLPIMPKPVTRIVRVTTKPTPMFGLAMLARLDITFRGNNIWVDSYDSGFPGTRSTPDGKYDPTLRRAGGDIASTLGIIDVVNANVNGKLLTGPEASYSVGSRGFVGDLDFFGPGIQDGWHENDLNVEIKSVQPPNTSSFVTPAAIVGDTNLFLLGSLGYIINGDLTVKSGETIRVAGNATVYVTGNVLMQGITSQINIDPGCSLTIYVAGASAAFTQINTTGNADSFRYFGLPTNRSLDWNGNAEYVGTIYAPQAVFTCGGGGSTLYDYQGSCVVESVKLNGHFKVHYDENLKRRQASGFVASSWQEL